MTLEFATRWLGAWRWALTVTFAQQLMCISWSEKAFEHRGSVVAFKTGVPIEVDGVRIDYLSPVSLGPQLEGVLDHPLIDEQMAVVPIEVLIYMKLAAKRRRDLVDVIELVRVGADVKRVREYLREYASDLVPQFEELITEALAE
jgi:hypothetical protein